MKVELSFNLPKEQCEFDTHLKAYKYKSVVDEFSEFLRQKLKYESDKLTEKEYSIYLKIQEEWHTIIRDNDL